MNGITVKFGGSSLSDADQIRKAAAIVNSNVARRFVVVSAPGKRFPEDEKITDLLYRVYREASAKEDFSETLTKVRARFMTIRDQLEVDVDLEGEFAKITEKLRTAPERDYTASRGEYLNGRLIAAYLGMEFLDPAEMICFSNEGLLLEEKTDRKIREAAEKAGSAVIPGFYGAFPEGRIKTFSRGGSDVTGSLVARATSSFIYENWTDVSGLMFTDPRIVEHPRTIDFITYKELRELSYMGASVLHEDAVFPVRKAGIPINIRNTNSPEDKGTMIVPELPEDYEPGPITGVAGKKGFVNVYVEKAMMNVEVGFGARLLTIFADYQLPFEHCPTGIDTIAVVVNGEEFRKHEEEIVERIQLELRPDIVRVEPDVSIIAVVGVGIIGHHGIASRVLKGVSDAGVNVLMIDSGAGEMNIIISVLDKDYEDAVRGIYREFNG